MPFSHDGFEDRVRRYPIPHLSAAETLGVCFYCYYYYYSIILL